MRMPGKGLKVLLWSTTAHLEGVESLSGSRFRVHDYDR
jgi:hypothetical protein